MNRTSQTVSPPEQTWAGRLETLYHAALALFDKPALVATLRAVVRLGRELTGARYAAIILFAPDGRIAHWLPDGLSDDEVAAIGAPPRGSGLLGALWRETRPVRLRDVRADPRHTGFPPHHPPLGGLLCVPILSGEKNLGSLYLGQPSGAGEFSAEDQRLMEILAAYAALAIRQAQAAERLDQQPEYRGATARQYLAGASHELRTPLAAIKGFASTLLQEDVGWDEPTRREFLRLIDAESDRLAALVEDLLELSRAEAGALEIKPEPCDVSQIAREALADRAAALAGHRLVVEFAAEAAARADASLTFGVIARLLDHAARCGPPGTAVALRVVGSGAGVCVEVSDEGAPIPPAHLERVFEHFHHIPGRPPGPNGPGLALTLARTGVEAMGGRIWAENRPGSGVVIAFTLQR